MQTQSVQSNYQQNFGKLKFEKKIAGKFVDGGAALLNSADVATMTKGRKVIISAADKEGVKHGYDVMMTVKKWGHAIKTYLMDIPTHISDDATKLYHIPEDDFARIFKDTDGSRNAVRYMSVSNDLFKARMAQVEAAQKAAK